MNQTCSFRSLIRFIQNKEVKTGLLIEDFYERELKNVDLTKDRKALESMFKGLLEKYDKYHPVQGLGFSGFDERAAILLTKFLHLDHKDYIYLKKFFRSLDRDFNSGWFINFSDSDRADFWYDEFDHPGCRSFLKKVANAIHSKNTYGLKPLVFFSPKFFVQTYNKCLDDDEKNPNVHPIARIEIKEK